MPAAISTSLVLTWRIRVESGRQNRLTAREERVPALDATGLEGGYTCTVNFSPVGLIQGNAGGRGGEAGPAPGGAALAASEPNGAISLPEALDRQLGLKLELQKRPMPVLVFDHIAEKPVE